MRLARVSAGGRVRPALLAADGTFRDLSASVDDLRATVLQPAGLAALARLDPAALPPLEAGPLAPPIAGIGKIIGVGLNYRAHAAECNLALPKEPTLFLKPGSALAGPDGPVIMPQGGTALDWEVELGVVIGEPGAYIQPGQAMRHVAGYVLGIDFSERVFQFDRGGQGFKGKSSDSFAPLGPWFVSADEVPDPQALRLTLSVNGTVRQDGDTADMIFPVAELVATISRFMSLQPGDVILTGTPAGVGMGQQPPSYLRLGDVVTAEAGRLGTQSHTVVASG
jgi:2-keto-4-pentenoate hydratase/2-oxohepta-3-ene-1,7-dioic acid hydratase in catechol pathway